MCIRFTYMCITMVTEKQIKKIEHLKKYMGYFRNFLSSDIAQSIKKPYVDTGKCTTFLKKYVCFVSNFPSSDV